MLGEIFITSLCVQIATASSRGDDSKIVGGRFIDDVAALPFIVSLQVKKIGHNCGGSLLTSYYVLSACHCLADVSSDDTPVLVYDTEKFLFVAGITDFEGDKSHSQSRDARVFHLHPQCSRKVTIIHDFAVGEMKQPFEITEYVKPFRLLTKDSEEFEDMFFDLVSDDRISCQVAGWGETRMDTENDAKASTKLKAVRMYVIPENHCQEMYGEREHEFKTFPFWLNGQVCAVSRSLNESDCLGDSGSPFFCGEFVVGVVSYGYECGTAMPSVYSGLKYFLQWFMSEVYPLRPGKDFDDPLNQTTRTNLSRLTPQSGDPEDSLRKNNGDLISSLKLCGLQSCTILAILQILRALL